jgi:hypothetical protein
MTMNDRCEHFRKLIADSISSDLTSSDKTALDDHLMRCERCRSYRSSLHRDDRLLLEYVNLFEPSISEIKSATFASIARSAEPAVLEPVPFWRNLMKPKYVAVIVIIVGALWAAGHFSGAFKGGAPALAEVLEEIDRARDVSYRLEYRIEGVGPFETIDYINSRGVRRKEYPEYDNVTITDPVDGKQFQINRLSKKVILTYRVGKPPREGLSDYLDWVQTLHRRSAEYTGVEKVDGRETHLFVNEEDIYYIIRVWVDPETDLPVKVQFVSIPNPNSDIISPSITLRKFDFGGDAEESKSVSYSSRGGITPASTVTMSDIVWNSDLDDSLFSMKVPGGYDLDVDSLDVSEDGEQNLIDALALWTEMSGGAFPEDINDLGASERAGSLLVAAYDGEDDPDREFDEAMTAANVLCKGCVFAQEMKVDGDWYYGGAGMRVGSAEVAVCWWRERDSDRFRIMYGDLRVVDIEEEDLPPRRGE